MARRSIGDELGSILVFVAAIWCVFVVGKVLPFDINSYGLTPRTTRGLFGIVAAPFLHVSFEHLVGNTVPLVVLLCLLAGSKAPSWAVVTCVVLGGGGLLWLLGRHATHIGASGLIFGLIAYLIVSGLREGRFIPLVTSLVVGLLYGGTLLSGVVPRWQSDVSWDGHLFGAIAGGATAYLATKSPDDVPNSGDFEFKI